MKTSASLVLVAFVVACGNAGVTPDAGVDGPSGDGADSTVSDGDASSGPSDRGVHVLFPPTTGADYAAVKTYLMNNPAVAGVIIGVEWSDFDLGAGNAHTSYDFTITDAVISEWVSAGKRINFAVQNTPYGGNTCAANGTGSHGTSGIGNCSMPPWVWAALGASNYTTCTSPTGNQQAPNFRSPTFVSAYQAAIGAFVSHYASNPSVGYLRVGLGKGGEINLPTGWNDTTSACGQAFTTAWGYTVGTDASATWNAYLHDMVVYEGSLNSPKRLMVSITPVTGEPVANAVPDYIAPIAVAQGVGFGNQGLQYSDTTNYPKCGGDWCQLFNTFTGQTLLELQTLGPSCPGGAGTCTATDAISKLSNATGSLPQVVPFGVSHHVDSLEIYYQDWLIAFDPTNANYASHGAAYARALQAAASAL